MSNEIGGDDPFHALLVLRAAHSAGSLRPPSRTRLIAADVVDASAAGVPEDIESDRVNLVYMFGPEVRATASLSILRSDRAPPSWLRKANPGNWEPLEWDELIDGLLGPWTIGVIEERVVSLCHAPLRMTERFAECGVWTHPELRGRGFAAAVTAAWAAVAAKPGRDLFYTTYPDNHASQRVAQRVGLRFIGYELAPERAHAQSHSNVHPLSQLRRTPRSTPN